MQIDLSPQEVRTLLNWWRTSRHGIYGSLDTDMGTLREITLADRLKAALEPQFVPAGTPLAAILETEDTALRVVREEAARLVPEFRRCGHEIIVAGVVHSVPPSDPQHWSVADLQVEPLGAERPSYRYLSSDLPVWRDGASQIGPEGATLRQEARRLLEQWLGELARQRPAG